jgi:hypothetical protein
MIRVRRSSPYFSTISLSSARLGQDVRVVQDLGRDLVVILDDLLPLERSEPAQLQVEDGDRLDLIDLQQRHQAGLGLIG